MSAIKKGFKKATKFVRKHWRKIIIAAAIVMTAGVATVGLAGFSSAAAAAGGGFAGALSAAGSTFVAGLASIGGTLGIGQGVTAATAGGAFASAPVMAGVAQGAGLTLGSGAAAQAMGMAASTAAPAGISVGGGVSGGVGAGNAAGAANAANAARSGIQLGGGMSGGVGSSMGSGAANTAGAAGGAQPGMLSRFMSNPNSGMMLQAGMGLVNGYMQGRAQDEDWERMKPKGFWGVGLNGTPNATGPMVPGGLMWNADSFRNPQARNAIGPNMAMEPGSQVDPYTGEVIAETPLPYDPQQGAPTRGRI